MYMIEYVSLHVVSGELSDSRVLSLQNNNFKILEQPVQYTSVLVTNIITYHLCFKYTKLNKLSHLHMLHYIFLHYG